MKINLTTVISAITGVFTAMMEWAIEAISAVQPVFYSTTSGLTFIGTLAVTALGLSVFFLIMGLIQNFLHFRG